KLLFILFCLFLSMNFFFSAAKIKGIYTTLVVVEEQENEKFVSKISKSSPVTDGIFEALWNKNEYIFFDMMIDKPLSIVQDKLDIEPFLLAARESGADSILLIKFHYSSKEEKAGLRIKADGVFFNLYSLNHLKSIREGEIKVKVNEYIEISKKVETLKKIGFNVLNKIYK
ncbi:MAG: hypothetical protein KAT05_16940, partial [Spirochaetes bacterium]|nr:hypothetical protein [Spirochaetota bacterium]